MRYLWLSLLVVLCADVSFAAERFLYRFAVFEAFATEPLSCPDPVVLVRAPTGKDFKENALLLQKLVFVLRRSLTAQCTTLSSIRIKGEVNGETVYAAQAKAGGQFKLEELDPPAQLTGTERKRQNTESLPDDGVTFQLPESKQSGLEFKEIWCFKIICDLDVIRGFFDLDINDKNAKATFEAFKGNHNAGFFKTAGSFSESDNNLVLKAAGFVEGKPHRHLSNVRKSFPRKVGTRCLPIMFA